MKVMDFKLLDFFSLTSDKFQIKNALQFLIIDIYSLLSLRWYFWQNENAFSRLNFFLPESQVMVLLQGGLEHSSPSFLTVLQPATRWVPDQLLLAQNDTRTEAGSSHNAFSVCKLRLRKVQCPTGRQYPSRLFCWCTGNKDENIKNA